MKNELKIGIVIGVILVAGFIVFFSGGQPKREPLKVPPLPEPVSEPAEVSAPEEKPVVPAEPAAMEIAASETGVSVEPAVPAEAVAAASEEKPVVPAEPAEAEEESAANRYYVVQEGDTLTGIAELYYGQGRHWKVIYQANRDVITNPERLQPGWNLRIPSPQEVLEP